MKAMMRLADGQVVWDLCSLLLMKGQSRSILMSAGRESTSKEGDLCGLFQNPASVQEKVHG